MNLPVRSGRLHECTAFRKRAYSLFSNCLRNVRVEDPDRITKAMRENDVSLRIAPESSSGTHRFGERVDNIPAKFLEQF